MPRTQPNYPADFRQEAVNLLLSSVAAAHLRREGWALNDKRAQRLWRLEGLKVPRRQRKLRRMGGSENSAQRRRQWRWAS